MQGDHQSLIKQNQEFNLAARPGEHLFLSMADEMVGKLKARHLGIGTANKTYHGLMTDTATGQRRRTGCAPAHLGRAKETGCTDLITRNVLAHHPNDHASPR